MKKDIIQLLPEAIANQIAAGEVVQRPASVVKELLENAIDAYATTIKLIVRDSGKVLIQVVDDGLGMTETDARMSFERHATSKIRSAQDLFKIKTMGFRGEALASIAAVAQVEMRSCQADASLGTFIRIEASEIKTQESVAAPQGTNIQVKNLFYNIPARRNFLKSNSVEMRHILDEFQRVALANPEVAFSLHHNDTEVHNLPAGKLNRRIIDVFGKNYREQLGICQEETPYISVEGYIGKPQAAKKTRGEQFFFVNKRFIRQSYLHHAVQAAFEGLIPEANHPFYVLFIDIDPAHIDINVHPTKTEIKFEDERSVYGIINAAVRKAIMAFNLSPSLDFDSEINVNQLFTPETSKPIETNAYNSWESGAISQAFAKIPTQKTNLSSWNKLFEGLENQTIDTTDWFEKRQAIIFQPEPAITFQSKVNDIKSRGDQVSERNCFQLLNRFVISQEKNGALLINQKAAYERILFEKYVQTLDTNSGASQQLLFPVSLVLSSSDFQIVQEVWKEIIALGFAFTEIGQNTLLIQGVPADVQDENEKELLESILEQYKHFSNQLHIEKRESLVRALAKRSAARYHAILTNAEMNLLIDQLFACATPHFTPSGEPTTVLLTANQIAELFR